MKGFKILFFLLLMLSAGCVQDILMKGIEQSESIPKLTYVTYLYSSGAVDRYRVAFLRNPESDVDVVADSVQIIKTTGTFDDAMAFMQRGAYKKIDVRAVTYRGKTLGYLLTQYMTYSLFSREPLEVSLYEHSGKIYFSVWEKRYD